MSELADIIWWLKQITPEDSDRDFWLYQLPLQGKEKEVKNENSLVP